MVLGVWMIVKPEWLWRVEHFFCVKEGEMTGMYRSLMRAGGVFFIVSALAAVAFSGKFFRQSQAFVVDGEHFLAEASGDALILSLPANPTTGYSWEVTEISSQLRYEGQQFLETEDGAGRLGAGGTAELFFTAQDAGTGTARLEYKRPWDGGETDSLWELTVEISEIKGNLQVEQISFVEIGTQ